MKIAVFTGAGISAESGIKTFRDSNGLWENHDIMEVASPEGWHKNPKLVLDFYNKRRKQLLEVKPNKAHCDIANLAAIYQVSVITQNVDDLHERAGSKQVLHLHGELLKARSTGDENYIINWKKKLNMGDLCPKDHQLRPHIVWFGESVPAFEKAIQIVEKCDYLIIVGTSLQVYPAASLMQYAPYRAKIIYIDPNATSFNSKNITVIQEKASTGVAKAIELINKH